MISPEKISKPFLVIGGIIEIDKRFLLSSGKKRQYYTAYATSVGESHEESRYAAAVGKHEITRRDAYRDGAEGFGECLRHDRIGRTLADIAAGPFGYM